MKRTIFISLMIFISFLFLLIGRPQPLLAKEIYKVAFLPEYLPIEMWQRFNPLMTYLGDTLGVRFELIIPRNFEHHIELVKKGGVDFFYQNPYVFLEVWETSSPLTLTEKGKKWGIEFRGVIITRKASGINKIEDLKGKKVSIVSLHSAGGFIAQKVLLRGRLDVYADLSIVEAKGNKQENVIFDVILKRADAGFVAEEVLGRIESKGLLSPGEVQEIKVIAYTDYIPNWVFSANKELPAEVKKMVQEALLNIPLGHPVLKAAKIRRFAPIPANYLEEYRAKIQGR
ncbi:MAG: phosphate/phosphite/phosphonate ABC transporter substrate-binding protein [Deltaproteobacteria bacterium]|nr:phosphate/phosphite/phosphonate ABC transporter substrate-binding protein [Deltaproteobacteria bacterium]